MRNVLLIIVIVLLAALLLVGGVLVWLYSRPASPPTVAVPPPVETLTGEPNTTVIVQQSAVNGLLAAVFPIEGEGTLLRKPIEIAYNWKLTDARVEFQPGSAIFYANARVHILGKTHEISAQGQAEIRYDSLAQEMYLDIHEIQAHTDAKVLGIPLDKLNLGPKEADVRLLRHLPLVVPFKVKKPQGVREEVQFAVAGHLVRFERGHAVVDLKLRFMRLSEGVETENVKPQSK
jgi:hypothetical protein